MHKQSEANLAAANSNLNLAIAAVDQFCSKVSEDLRLKEQDLRPLRKELLTSAVEFQKQLVELRNKSGAARIDLARSHAMLGRLSMEIDSVDQAIASFRLAIDEYRKLATDLSNTSSDRLARKSCDFELARCCYLLAQLLGRSNKAAEGKEAANMAIETLQRSQQSEPESALILSTLAHARIVQSQLALDTQQFEDAEAFSKMAIASWTKLTQEQPNDHETLLNLAKAQSKLGSVLFHRKISRWREAEALLLQSLLVSGGLTIAISPLPLINYTWPKRCARWGQICKVTQRGDEAVKYMSEAVDTVDGARLKQPSVRSHVIQLASLYNELSVVHALNGRPAEERRCLEVAVELLDSLQCDTDVEMTLAVATNLLGKSWLNDGKLPNAEPLLDRAIGLGGESPGAFTRRSAPGYGLSCHAGRSCQLVPPTGEICRGAQRLRSGCRGGNAGDACP